MRLDPSVWAISLVGCFYDWLMTRKWKKILLGMIPLLVFFIAVALVVRGQTLDKDVLATWYLQLGEKEIEGWEKQWAPEAATGSDIALPIGTKETDKSISSNAGESKQDNPPADKSSESNPKTAGGTPAPTANKPPAKPDDKEISPFAMTLFRRVLQLQAGDQRAQWIVAMIMAQRGSYTQANERMTKIAPDDREGYLPAHAWMALYAMQQGVNADNVKTVLHHLTTALKAARVPVPVLVSGSELFWRIGQRDLAITTMQRAAQTDPQYYLTQAMFARATHGLRSKGQDNPPPTLNHAVYSMPQLERIAEQAEQQSVLIFTNKLQQDPRDSQSRLLLAEAFVNQKRLDEAEAVLHQGLSIKETPQLKRGLSEVWRLKYVLSRAAANGQVKLHMQALEQAFLIDPSNPKIAEEVVQLAKMGGEKPSKELLEQLQTFLAEGKATSTTHAWIAQHHLILGEYKESIPHLEQVINRLPDAAEYLNNLAYVLAKVAPDRLGEALGFARRATKLEPTRADFHDTQGIVLMAMNYTSEALTEFEEAIRLEPNRAEFHTRAAEVYTTTGDPVMAKRHQEKAQVLMDQAAADTGQAQPTTTYAPEPKVEQILPQKTTTDKQPS